MILFALQMCVRLVIIKESGQTFAVRLRKRIQELKYEHL